MRQTEPYHSLITLGFFNEGDFDHLSENKINALIYSKRYAIEQLLSVLYCGYNPRGIDAATYQQYIIDLIVLLQKFPSQGTYSSADLRNALRAISAIDDHLQASSNASCISESNLKSFINKTQLFRALIARSIRATSRTIDSDAINSLIFPIMCVSAALPLLRLSITVFFMLRYVLGFQLTTHEEKERSLRERFGYQFQKNWPQLFQDGPFSLGRLLSCLIPTLVYNPQSVTLSLFSYSAIKAIATVAYENHRYNQLSEQIASRYRFGLFSETFSEGKKRLLDSPIKLAVIWSLLAISALVAFFGSVSDDKEKGKMLQITGSWCVALWTIAHIAHEFTRKNSTPLILKNNMDVVVQLPDRALEMTLIPMPRN